MTVLSSAASSKVCSTADEEGRIPLPLVAYFPHLLAAYWRHICKNDIWSECGIFRGEARKGDFDCPCSTTNESERELVKPRAGMLTCSMGARNAASP